MIFFLNSHELDEIHFGCIYAWELVVIKLCCIWSSLRFFSDHNNKGELYSYILKFILWSQWFVSIRKIKGYIIDPKDNSQYFSPTSFLNLYCYFWNYSFAWWSLYIWNSRHLYMFIIIIISFSILHFMFSNPIFFVGQGLSFYP